MIEFRNPLFQPQAKFYKLTKALPPLALPNMCDTGPDICDNHHLRQAARGLTNNIKSGIIINERSFTYMNGYSLKVNV